MIQFNSVSLLDNNSGASSTSASASQSSADFQNQLSSAINATLEQFGVDPSQVNITIGSPTTSSSSSTLTGFAAIAAAVTPASISASTTTSNTTPDAQTDPAQSFDEAYWAKQPAAVQALQNIDDPMQREMQAANLAAEGYTIDVPIMSWGWDPSKVTELRQSFGYTWVPSAMQAPIEQAPGLTGYGQPYNPNNPPSDSIPV